MFKNKTKAYIIMGSILLSGLTAVPVFAEEVSNTPDLVNFANIKTNNIQKSIESKNLEDFNKELNNIGFNHNLDQSDFDVVINAYTKAKSGDIQGAQKIMRDSDISPMFNRFIMGQHMQLTIDQKESIKKAENLIKEGKKDEAKSVLVESGLPTPFFDSPKHTQKEALKNTINQAKVLKSEGKTEEAKQVLQNAGIPEKSFRNLEKEFSRETQKDKKSFFGTIKNFFKFSKN